jgi:sugar transferase (PEP-CTERM/EpsH1 system associated)
MAKVLFLAHRAPFPPNKGDKIRAFHILEHLAARHEVWLGAAADDAADLQHLAMAKTRYAEAYFAPLGGARRALNMLGGALAGAPLSVARFRHPALERWIDHVLADVRPDVVYVYSSALAQYVTGRTRPETRVVIDFVDADAEKWRAYAERAKAPMRWVYGAEFRRLVRFDRKALAAATAGILVSETERRLLAGFLPQDAAKLQVIPNGVNTDYFQPGVEPSDGRSIVFCGTMDYRPNVEGAVWFAREILPKVRAAVPAAVFRIVGAKPSAQVLALAGLEGVEVTGAVPDVRPYLAQAAVIVAPLRIARGIQNKVLEGMAAGRPMVATPEALDGIDAEVGRDVLTGADATGLASAVGDVLEGRAPADLGQRGRDYVVAHHQWAGHLKALDRIISDIVHPPSRQASA